MTDATKCVVQKNFQRPKDVTQFVFGRLAVEM